MIKITILLLIDSWLLNEVTPIPCEMEKKKRKRKRKVLEINSDWMCKAWAMKGLFGMCKI